MKPAHINLLTGLLPDAKNTRFSGSLPRPLRGLQGKLILPYLFLTLLLAWIGIFIITTLVVNSQTERFHNSLLEASRITNDGFVNYEKTQLERLRFLIFTDGMPKALENSDTQTIFDLMRPVLANSHVQMMSAVNAQGQEIVTYGKDATQNSYHRQEGTDFSGMAIISRVLSGAVDDQGDKYVQVVNMAQVPVFFTAAPVRDAQQKITGVLMVGTYLPDILQDLKNQSLADVLVYDPNGNLVASTLTGQEEGFATLGALTRGLDPQAKTQSQQVTLNQRAYLVAFSPFVIRGQRVGWLGVLKNSEYLVSNAVQTRNLFVGIFSIATLGMILIGNLLAQNIARPILRLRTLSQAVASGNLNQKMGLHRADEIGDLAGAFDTMTVHLRERTEQAERLYAESLQRNKELAQINARLEATQSQLVQSEKLAAIGQLTAGIVHDVKNPFAVIMGMSELLGDDETLDEETRSALRAIHESAVKGNTIVSDLLKFARQSKSEMRARDIRETVETAMRLTAYLTRRYQTRLNLPDHPVWVSYDAQQIEQVLINMIHNAIQAMPEKGALTLTLTVANGSAYLRIQDTGSGIAPENQKRIFDPFFTTKPEGQGTGLGLSVSYGIIANHHGKIEIESALGSGTTFIISMPEAPRMPGALLIAEASLIPEASLMPKTSHPTEEAVA